MAIVGPVRDGPPSGDRGSREGRTATKKRDGSALRWAGQPPLGNGLVSPGLVSPKFLRGRALCDLGSYSKQRPRV